MYSFKEHMTKALLVAVALGGLVAACAEPALATTIHPGLQATSIASLNRH
jgi:hypothetical protein